MTQIAQALTRIFDRHRIVFWYDEKNELRGEYDGLTLPNIEKIEIADNQFGVKYRILRQEPEQKFLIYHAGPRPQPMDNWLLDVELAHGHFSADQSALWLTELGLGLEFVNLVAPHTEFFASTRRREALKAMLAADDSERRIRLKMLAVCAATEARLDEILEALLADLAAGKDEKIKLIGRSALDDFLWEEVGRTYGYRAAKPGLRDFMLVLFGAGYALALGEATARSGASGRPAQETPLVAGAPRLTGDAVVFLKRWKDSVRHHETFEALSTQAAEDLDIQQDLTGRDYRSLVDLDYFEIIDRKILSDLVLAVTDRTLPAAECANFIRRRRQSHWFDRYQHPYEAVEHGVAFLHLLDTVDLTIRSLAHGVEQYSRVWYQLDQHYRKFIYHATQSGLPTLLAALTERVENFYINNYVLKVNDLWQPWVDVAARWEAAPVLAQRDFFEQKVRPFLARGNKIFVVISDALRYEIGEELLRLIRQEDRYDAELSPALTQLPSYTQLGMAALLPNESLTIVNGDLVLVDGNSSQGMENRKKILDRALPGRATAVGGDDFLRMNRDDSRALFRDHEVVYIYQNRIDATGDKRDSEEQVFEAVEKALEELVLIVKKLSNANVTNMIVTADHGFLYQHRDLEESDFAGAEAQGREIIFHNRRFVLGRGLSATAGFKKFQAAEVGLIGDLEILLPKSINRLRQRGAGSRYVHGGCTLQEVIVPVVMINKKRQSDVTSVDVDILRGTNSVISAGQLTVAFYQLEPVTEKVQARRLRAGIYTNGGALISDQHELTFDSISDNARLREVRVQFVLTREADAANNQEVILRLDEQVADTSHYREYRSARYMLRRSFTSDFDL
ncbi:BREX-1 system phosphatase PglZ type A [bacterium]|nr:BREX-1 system phosphatase PglZ type A [bacterium]